MSEHDIQHTDGTGGPRTGDLPTADDQDARVADLEARMRELEDAWKRALADGENLRKRMERETERVRAAERAQVATAWLPVLDNLDLALDHAGADPGSIVAGVRAIRDQALAVVAALGFPRHDDLGTTFDPNRHEAVSVQPVADAEPGTIVGVLRPGYGDAERRLRPASVVVAAEPPQAKADAETAGAADGR